jgi:Arc/MetJ-type ribon-helix-helix transcriptional regulator
MPTDEMFHTSVEEPRPLSQQVDSLVETGIY